MEYSFVGHQEDALIILKHEVIGEELHLIKLKSRFVLELKAIEVKIDEF